MSGSYAHRDRVIKALHHEEPIVCLGIWRASIFDDGWSLPYLAFQGEYTLEELYPGKLEAYSQRTITTIPELKGYLELIRED